MLRAKHIVLSLAGALIALVASVLVVDALVRWRPLPSPPSGAALAADIDEYLRIREDSVPGVKPALRKGIVWHDSLHRRTPLAIVYLHGFSASRAEVSPVIERLGDSLHANIFFTRLAAHGRVDGEAFATVSPQQWIDDAREAYTIGRRIGDRVVLVGMSTGALLAMQVAAEARASGKPAALILISPDYEPADWRAQFVAGPFGAMVARIAGGRYHSFTPENAMHAELWTARYRSQGLNALMNLVRYARTIDVSRITVPLLTLYTHRDDVVRVDLIRSRHMEFGSYLKDIIDVQGATGHVLAGDALAPQETDRVVGLMLRFIRANVERK